MNMRCNHIAIFCNHNDQALKPTDSSSLCSVCSVDTVLPWKRIVICFDLQQKSLWCVVTVRECSVWSSLGWFKC